jgi:hypothetical protein
MIHRLDERNATSVENHGRCLAGLLVTSLLAWGNSTAVGQEAPAKGLREPVFRVSTVAKSDEGHTLEVLNNGVPNGDLAGAHPLDEALAMARQSLDHIEKEVRDYTCTLVKRELVGGELQEHEFMSCKVRHARVENGRQIPFAVYLSFHKPNTMRGREVIYVVGRNAGKLVAHEGGLKGRVLPTVHLLPHSVLALRGNRYPITEIGILTLTKRLIENGERDKRLGECKVRLVDGAKVKGRVCTMLEVVHPDRNPQFDFHVARVFLDDELNLPIRYEAYDWPTTPGGAPVLLEEYTYMDLKLNVGLEDADFDYKNPDYRF